MPNKKVFDLDKLGGASVIEVNFMTFDLHKFSREQSERSHNLRAFAWGLRVRVKMENVEKLTANH